MAQGINVANLEGKKEGSSTIVPRDFFWDSVALFVLSAIAGLAVLDFVTEFIKGSTVECFLPNGFGQISKEYVNAFCSGNLPFIQYFPVYIIITGALIAVPHYLWLNNYRGNFEFFFSQVGNLTRPKDTETVAQSKENIEIVKRLTTVFATYKQSTIFLFYVMKLIAQLVFSAASLVLGVLLFLNYNFTEEFRCPKKNETEGFWPFEEKAFCIYNTLVLVSYLRVAYLVLISFLLICLIVAIFWCFLTKATELGHEDVAKFCYLTGLPAKYYVAQLPIPSWRCCKYLRGCILRCVSTIPWFTFGEGPRIHSDLDFMVMQLFRTDSGLGHTFKDTQTNLAIKKLLEDDHRRLHIHYLKHTNTSAYDEERPKPSKGTKKKKRVVDSSVEYLKWKFTKEKEEIGLYFEYEKIPSTQPLKITDTLMGAILGYGASASVPKDASTAHHQNDALFNNPPKIMNAISISFDSVGYGTTLARTFNWVGSVNFSSSFEPQPDSPPAECTHFYSNLVSIVCREDVLSAEAETRTKFEKTLRNLWFPTPDRRTAYETSFIVLGPIPSDNPGHLTTVELFLGQISECLGKDAILLTLTPENINGKYVEEQFSEYIPLESRFVKHKLIVQKKGEILEWQARESMQLAKDLEVEQKKASPKGAALTTDKEGEISLLEMSEEDTSESESESKGMIPKPPASDHEYSHHLKCGKNKINMKFATYRSAGFHYRTRRKEFLPHIPPPKVDTNVQQQTTEPSVKKK